MRLDVTPMPNPTSVVVGEVFAERERQKSVEGFDPGRDDGYVNGELPYAAACYAIADQKPIIRHTHVVDAMWPWDESWLKPTTHRRNLVKAAALLIAEIERIDRASA